jgi:hypothetical protein
MNFIPVDPWADELMTMLALLIGTGQALQGRHGAHCLGHCLQENILCESECLVSVALPLRRAPVLLPC